MTKNEAYVKFECWHCAYLDTDSGGCLCGDPDSDECQKGESNEALAGDDTSRNQ